MFRMQKKGGLNYIITIIAMNRGYAICANVLEKAEGDLDGIYKIISKLLTIASIIAIVLALIHKVIVAIRKIYKEASSDATEIMDKIALDKAEEKYNNIIDNQNVDQSIIDQAALTVDHKKEI